MEKVESNVDGLKKIVESSNGVVVSLESFVLDFPSLAIGVKSKNIPGTRMSIQSADGSDTVLFPDEFSAPEISALRDRHVKYFLEYTSFYEGGAGYVQGWK